MKVPVSWLKEYVDFEDTIEGLADKLTLADRCVSLESRFERALRRYRADPVVRHSIAKRRAVAMALKTKVEQFTGRPLSQIYQG